MPPYNSNHQEDVTYSLVSPLLSTVGNAQDHQQRRQQNGPIKEAKLDRQRDSRCRFAVQQFYDNFGYFSNLR